ncbi:hypothetical protein FAVG1_12151 [Fusarium avenaceum]|nr:hypothetical protein FAVG1_12151 [Fusarium avenaceum]
MSTGGQNIYSQAFNFSSLAEHSVDPRTGQYGCAIHLYQAPAKIRNCPHFDLSLHFDSLSSEDVGFGRGWSLNLSKYNHRHSRTLSLITGENYKVVDTKTTLAVKDLKLNSFLFERSGPDYRVTHKSGDIEILSNAGDNFNITVPVKLYAVNGRSLDLEWITSGETPRLSQVREGTEILLSIDYPDFQVDVVMSPNTSGRKVTSLIRGGECLLTEVRMPLDNSSTLFSSWKFEYEHGGPFLLIRQLTTPTGLVEVVTYRHKGHKLPKGAPMTTIPHALSLTVYPGKQQEKMVTTYSFSDFNFLGYGGVNDWNSDGDNLFQARSEYQYTSTAQVKGGAEFTYVYNKFHLMVSVRRQQNTKAVTQTTTYHALENESFENQIAQYQLPKAMEMTYADFALEGASRTEKSFFSFDIWGNPTETIEKDGTKTIREYYSEDGESDSCPADPRGFRRYLKCEARTPPDDGLTRSKEFRYTQLETAGENQSAGYFVLACHEASLEDDHMISRAEYSHVNDTGSRDHGSIRQQVSWMGDQHVATKNKSRHYPDGATCKETVTSSSFDGHVTNVETSTSLSTGRVLRKKDRYGTETVFGYDNLGRIIEEIVAPATVYEASRKKEYLVDKDGIGYGVTKTDAKGVQTRYITDGMERVVRVEKQDLVHQNPSAVDGVFLVIQESFYNKLGQCVQVDKIDWMSEDHVSQTTPKQIRTVKRIEYDDWGTMCRSVDAMGIVHLATKDPISMTQTTGIPGKGIVETKLNMSGMPIETMMLKSDGTLHGKTSYEYDGWDRLVAQKDSLDRITRYKYDNFDRVVETLGPDGSISRTDYASRLAGALPTKMEIDQQTLGSQQYDGLARSTTNTAGNRTSVAVYNSDGPHPTQITTANGDHHQFSYEPILSHALVNTKSPDGEVALEHDKQTGAIVRIENKTSIINRTYLSTGLIASEEFRFPDGRTLSTASTYSLAGLPRSYVDVHDHKREIEYDSHGRTAQLAQGTVKVGFKYNQEGLVSETRIQHNDGEEDGHGLQIQMVYDDFGHEIERCIRHANDGSVIYQIRRTFNVANLIVRRLVEDGLGNVLREETFAYDIRDRLVSYECQGSQPPQDENGWKVRKQSFSFDTLNNLVDIHTSSQDGTENTKRYLYDSKDPTKLARITNTSKTLSGDVDLLYDGNGCLIRDEKQRTLEYDTNNRLIAVLDGNGQLQCRYHYNALGQLIRQEAPDKPDIELHYHDGALMSITQGGSKTSYLTDGHVYWGEIVHEEGRKPQVQLWAPDSNQSVLASVKGDADEKVEHHEYTPYGLSTASSLSVGFNGQWRDPITGWYHLGNGYRVYSPSLMRFHTPDSWSPFISHEINPYTYCRGDPINNSDPSGHMTMTGRDWTVMGVGIGVGILTGVLTGGATLAVQVGVSIAVDVASDAITGAVYDAIAGPSQQDTSMAAASANPSSTAQSSSTNNLIWGVIGALIGTVLGIGVGKLFKKFPGSKVLLDENVQAVESLSVREIGFSQDSIKSIMTSPTGEINIAENIRNLAGLSAEDLSTRIARFPTLQLTRTEIKTKRPTVTKWLSVDNRRLAVFKQALKGVPDDRVPVEVLTTLEEVKPHLRKFTTTNFGDSISVRTGRGKLSVDQYLNSFI